MKKPKGANRSVLLAQAERELAEQSEARCHVLKRVEELRLVVNEQQRWNSELPKRMDELEEKGEHMEGSVYYDNMEELAQSEEIENLEDEEEELEKRINSTGKYKMQVQQISDVCQSAHRLFAKSEERKNLLSGHFVKHCNTSEKLDQKVMKLLADTEMINTRWEGLKKYAPTIFSAIDSMVQHVPVDTNHVIKRRIDHLASPKVRQELLAPSIDCHAAEEIDILINSGTKAPQPTKRVSKSRRKNAVHRQKQEKISPEESDQKIEELVKKKLKKGESAEETAGKKGANTIHGKKIKTVREIQKEQLAKSSVKEKAALLRKEQMTTSAIKEKIAAMKFEEEQRREEQAKLEREEEEEKKTATDVTEEPRTPPSSPFSILRMDLLLSPSPEKNLYSSPSPQKTLQEQQSASVSSPFFSFDSDDDDDRLVIVTDND